VAEGKKLINTHVAQKHNSSRTPVQLPKNRRRNAHPGNVLNDACAHLIKDLMRNLLTKSSMPLPAVQENGLERRKQLCVIPKTQESSQPKHGCWSTIIEYLNVDIQQNKYLAFLPVQLRKHFISKSSAPLDRFSDAIKKY